MHCMPLPDIVTSASWRYGMRACHSVDRASSSVISTSYRYLCCRVQEICFANRPLKIDLTIGESAAVAEFSSSILETPNIMTNGY